MITALHIFDGKTFYAVTQELDNIVGGRLIMIERKDLVRLVSLEVDLDARRKGMARALMQEALAWRPNKPYYIECDSFSFDESMNGATDEDLHRFYTSLGFRKLRHPFSYIYDARQEEIDSEECGC